MKNQLRLTVSALIWAMLLFAAYAVAAHAQTGGTSNPHAAKKNTTPETNVTTPAVTGTGTVGQITKWTSPSGIGDTSISEDKFGKVGIGTATPTSKLTVAGMIETTLSGYKFSDGTVQTTAGVAPDMVVDSVNGLKGNLTLQAGSNISITPVGNMLTIASTATDSGSHAFQRDLQVDLPLNQTLVSKDFDPPPGSGGLRFVIEYLSLEGAPLLKQIQFCTSVEGTQTCYPFLMTYTGPGRSIVDRSLRLYSDGNSKITVEVGRASATTIDGVTIHLSGYTVPLP
jgi:hypothetical protein